MRFQLVIQPVVEIAGAIHMHSQIFLSVDDAKAAIAKNKAYKWLGHVQHYAHDEISDEQAPSVPGEEKE